MKIKKQLSLPSKYWLLIVTGICIVFIGLSLISEKQPVHLNGLQIIL